MRKGAHMAAFAPALVLPWLTPGQALILAGALFFMNVFLLPRFAPALYRPHEPGHGTLEVILYPAGLFALVAAYGFSPEEARPPAAAAPWYLIPMGAWFALAWVDAAVGIGCRLLRAGPTLPWNARKPLVGVLLGICAALLAAWALASALAATGLLPGLASLSASAAWTLAGLLAVCALVETAWFGITDNLTVPFAFCVLAPLLPGSPIAAEWGIPKVTWAMLLVPIAFGLIANFGGMLTLAGALLGSAMAFVLMAAEPWLFLFLCGFFALAVSATRFRYAAKAARRVAEERGGRRGAAQVFGAMGAAAWMTPLVHLAESHVRSGRAGAEDVRAALLVCTAPFIAKGMDTVSSEMGKAIAGRTVSLRTLRRVPPGTEGAVSL
ncbi:MAG TPA: DUF92 domain-containing protein, partial [Fibrobacteria bacterium]|nr:DUF92 domain-containing protein [Fibrobacteria bacterium]